MKYFCSECCKPFQFDADCPESQIVCPVCQKKYDKPTDLGPGVVIGDFLIEKLISRGGMGEVFLARQLSLDRPVALKVLQKKFTGDQEYVDSLVHEARAAAKINHPNIVQAYTVGEEGGIYYFAMEYIRGETFKKILKEKGSLDFQTAAKVIRDVASALDVAWREQKLVHQDIKPDNIMIDVNGFTKLADLGLAKTAGMDNSDAEADEVLGTPQYISPEQLTGIPTDVRSDLYSLGATFYHFVTGHFAYEADTAEEITRMHVDGNLTPPQKVNPKLPDVLNAIIVKMMARKIDERYQDPKELMKDLDRFLSDAGKHNDTPRITITRNGSKPVLPKISVPAKGGEENNQSPQAAVSKSPVQAPGAKPVVPKPVVPKPVAAKPVVPKPVAAKPVVPKPVAAKPVVPKPVAAKPVVSKTAVLQTPVSSADTEKNVPTKKKNPAPDSEKNKDDKKQEPSAGKLTADNAVSDEKKAKPEKTKMEPGKRRRFLMRLFCFCGTGIFVLLLAAVIAGCILERKSKLPAVLQPPCRAVNQFIEKMLVSAREKALSMAKSPESSEARKPVKTVVSTRPEYIGIVDDLIVWRNANPGKNRELVAKVDAVWSHVENPVTAEERSKLEHLASVFALPDEELRCRESREKMKRQKDEHLAAIDAKLREDAEKNRLAAEAQKKAQQENQEKARKMAEQRAAEENERRQLLQEESRKIDALVESVAEVMGPAVVSDQDAELQKAVDNAMAYRLPSAAIGVEIRQKLARMQKFCKDSQKAFDDARAYRVRLEKLDENSNIRVMFARRSAWVISIKKGEIRCRGNDKKVFLLNLTKETPRTRSSLYKALQSRKFDHPAFYLGLFTGEMDSIAAKEIPGGYWKENWSLLKKYIH